MPSPSSHSDNTIPKLPYLGARLRSLYQWIEAAQQTGAYDEIWDCCCDHGYLGIKILARELCQRVHFVDQIPHLITNLQGRLAPYPSERYRTLAADASQLRFSDQQRHLIIIAGVGGENSVEILRQILPKHPEQSLDFLFCPATTQFDLREYLHEQRFALLHETMVTEKGRDYEVIGARWNSESSDLPQVSKTGNHWDLTNDVHHRYLTKLIKHYQRRTLGDNASEAQRILDIYQAAWNSLTCP